MLNWNGIVCLFLRHDFNHITDRGSLYRHCLRCGKTELKHFHPRLHRLDKTEALLAPVPVVSRRTYREYDAEKRTVGGGW